MDSIGKAAYRWTLRPLENEDLVRGVAGELNNLAPSLARALVLRGIGNKRAAQAFFRDGLESLHDPFQMRDMREAAERLAEAIARNERVLVYGDYDVDGTTSTALMVLFLRSFGVEAEFFIPNRFIHGYGLCQAGLTQAQASGATLVVALDCGITAHAEADFARSLGLDLVICDHHTPDVGRIPNAFAILNPKRSDCEYPFKELSGCGVGFKLIQATLAVLGRPAEEAFEYLDLVAVSTASDIVPLYGENRVLMREGLLQLNRSTRPGLGELARIANTTLDGLTASQIVFQIGPRINAAGRIDCASKAVDLLIASDRVDAARLADELEVMNLKRRELDQTTRDEAIRMAEERMDAHPDDTFAFVLHAPHWHAGVIGITASRVAEHFHRPAVMLSGADGEAKGSARSAGRINIHQALSECSDLLTRFGGHAFAAGLALPTDDIPELRERLSQAVGRMVTPEAFEPELEIDANLDLDDLNGRFWAVLRQFAPHGPDNPRPLFWSQGLRQVGTPETMGKEKKHLMLRVTAEGGGSSFRAIGFGLGHLHSTALHAARRGLPLDLVYDVDENHYRGQSSLQLRLKDLRVQEA